MAQQEQIPIINPSINPTISDPYNPNGISISLYQNNERLTDPEEYSSLVYNIESRFRKSDAYKIIKNNIMNAKGIRFDQEMRNIDADMANIELHHVLPTLKDATICIIESMIHTKNAVVSFEVLKMLELVHRENMMGIIMLTETNHDLYHADLTAFISIDQMYGNPLKFLDVYGRYFTPEIVNKWLLHFKLEEQYNHKSYWPLIAKARPELMSFNVPLNIMY